MNIEFCKKDIKDCLGYKRSNSLFNILTRIGTKNRFKTKIGINKAGIATRQLIKYFDYVDAINKLQEQKLPSMNGAKFTGSNKRAIHLKAYDKAIKDVYTLQKFISKETNNEK